MATTVTSGSYPAPKLPARRATQLLLPTTSVNAYFTGTGTLTADAAPVTAVTARYTGAGTLTAAVDTRTVAAVAADFTGIGTLTVTAIQPDSATDSITRIVGTTTPLAGMTVSLGAAATGLEPFTTQLITATITGTSSDAVTYIITQTVGPPVAVAGTGDGTSWTYRTPGVPATQTGAQIRFTITATKTGYNAATNTVEHYVYPAAAMDYDGTGAARGLSIHA